MLKSITLQSLAGTIFAVACNIILLGSTKIFTILVIYLDVLTGMPTRFIGNTLNSVLNKTNTAGQSTNINVGFVLKIYGDIIGTIRNFIENTDTFIGRYLVLITSGYVIFKLLHFKFFNNIF